MLEQSLPPHPQLLPQLPFPQQQNSRQMIMIHHRQEQLFPELKHINVTSLAFLNYTMHRRLPGNLTAGISGRRILGIRNR